MTISDSHELPASRGITLDAFRHGVVWLVFASSFAVLIEPAPTDILFFLAIPLFLGSGLVVSSVTTPLLIFSLLFLIGGFTSLIQVPDDFDAQKYMLISAYMVVSGLFFTYYFSTDTERRVALVANGWKVGGVIAAIMGVLGALNIAGLGEALSQYGRATGWFKDPNVFSTHITLPALLLVQAIMLGRTRHKILGPVALITIAAGIILSFSRGALLNFLLATAFMVLISFVLERQSEKRLRIVAFAVAGVLALVVLLMLLLSFEPVRAQFFDRLTLTKSYDAGETGRFGNQLNSIPELLTRPFGYGPLSFRKYFTEDPHNVYLNGFASYGWTGGFAYALLTISTLVVGFKSMLVQSRVQYMAISAFCVFLSTAVQGVQIDTDHWRHFYWLIGLVWGIFAATHIQQSTVIEHDR